MPKTRKNKRSLLMRLKRKPFLLTVALLLLVGVALGYWQLKDEQPAPETTADTQSRDYVNLEPATDVERQESEDKKVESENRPSPPPTTSGKKQVKPEITYADYSEVRAYVPGVFEDGGTCTATATKGTQTRTTSSKGFADYNKTTCEQMTWTLPSGTWSVVVSYSSGTAAGKSEAFEVK